MTEKPLVTVSGKKTLLYSKLHQRIVQDLLQEGVEWRRRLDSNSKLVYVDVNFVDFDVDNVERSSERLSRLSMSGGLPPDDAQTTPTSEDNNAPLHQGRDGVPERTQQEIDGNKSISSDTGDGLSEPSQKPLARQLNDVSQAFFSQKLLGTPVLHTYWADKNDFEDENQKFLFDAWIGQVQGSTCTEWAIVIIEDGDFKAQFGTALFKSKLQPSTSQANASSSSIASMSQTSASLLDRMKKGLSTIFQSDSNSDRWLTLINQERSQDSNKAQESYTNFLKKLRNIIMSSFSKQIELFEEQLRIQRELRAGRSWDFLSHFLMQEELAFAFEFLTLFDEALVQYDLLDALFTEHISSPNFNSQNERLYRTWTSFDSWPGLCLDMNCDRAERLRERIVEKRASLLDYRNYLFARQCYLMLMQNQPWRVAASTCAFLQNCIREHEILKIKLFPGALTSWSFVSALEVLQKCECYSCTSTMENYSLYTVDIWNAARTKLLELGRSTHQLPGMTFDSNNSEYIEKLLAGLGQDPHGGVSYQSNEISPYARLKDALSGKAQYSKHLVEISELTLGTFKHIGRKRHALIVGKEMADFYMAQDNFSRALPFLVDLERSLLEEDWRSLLLDVKKSISLCDTSFEKPPPNLAVETAVESIALQ